MSSNADHYPPKFTAESYTYQPYVDCKNWVAGRWVDAANGDTLVVDNPRHSAPLGRC